MTSQMLIITQFSYMTQHVVFYSGSYATGSLSDGDVDDATNPNRVFVAGGFPSSPPGSRSRGSEVEVSDVYREAINGKHRNRHVEARQEFGTAW